MHLIVRERAAHRVLGSLATVAMLTSSVALFGAPARAASVVTTTYAYTGATQIFAVPAGVTAVTVTLTGGQGGKGGHDSQGTPTPGGYQGVVNGTISVTPGDLITVAVGGGGGIGVSSRGSAAGGSAGANPLVGYDGAVGGVAGPGGSSGGGGGSGAASVLQVNGVEVVAGGAGGNGGSGQHAAIVGRRAEDAHLPRADQTSTGGRPGMNTIDACSPGFGCDGGASGAGGGGASGGERGTIQYGGSTATEYFGFGGYPGSNATGGLAGLSGSYDYYAGNSAHGSIAISYDDGAPGAPSGLTGTAGNGSVALAWNAPVSSGSDPIIDYVVEHAIDPAGPYAVFVDGVSTEESTTVTGLTNGTTYYFRVAAVNGLGAGPNTPTMSIGIVPSDVPDAPTVDALVPFDSGIFVDFTPGASDSAVTGYEYRLGSGEWLSGSVASNRLTIPGLVNGQTYSVQLRARNAIGAGDPSAPPQSATPRAVPTAPATLTAVSGAGSVDLTWTSPASDNGSAIIDYVVQHAIAIGGPYTTFEDSTSIATGATVTGLANGVVYYLRVAAVNAVGTSGYSTPVAAAPFITPDAPTIALVAPDDGRLTVDITPGFDGGSPVSGYEYRLDGIGGWHSTGSVGTQFIIGGLSNGISYSVAVRARNAAGPSAASLAAAGTPRTVPSAPSIAAVALETGAVGVSFNVGSDGGSAITNVEYSIDGTTWIPRSPDDPSSPLTISGLVGGQTYAVTLRLRNTAGPSAASNTSSVTAKGTPDAPLVVSVTASDRALAIAFDAPVNGGTPISNYEYSTDDGATWTARSPASTSSSLTIDGLTNGMAYQVRMRAVNAVGSGAASTATVGVPRTTPSAPTINGSTVSGSGGVLDVAFTAPPSDGGSSIVGYEYSTDGGATWRIRTTGTTGSPLQITTLSSDGTTQLAGGWEYPVEVRAVNAAGPGVASAVATGITTTTPGAPTVETVIAGDSSATIRFTVPANGGSNITRFEYRLDVGTWTDTGSLSNEFVISGLSNSVTYEIAVRAVNGVGDGPASSAAPVQVFTTPGAPSIDGVAADNQSLRVDFTAGAHGGSPIVGYEYSTDGGSTWRSRTTGTTGSPMAITTTSATDTALANATVYPVQVRAVNAAGAGAASLSWLAAPRGAPAAPAVVGVTPGDGTVKLALTWGSDGGSSITVVEYSIAGGAWVDTGSLSSPVTVSGLVNGQSYDIAVRARNAIGEGASSTPVTAIPRTVANAPSSVTPISSDGSVSVSWVAPSSDGGAALTGYVVTLHNAPTGGDVVGQCTTTVALGCTVSGLTNGVALYVDAVATNAAGTGSASSPRVAVTPVATPTVAIATIAAQADSLSIGVSVTSTGGAAILDYEYRLDGGSWQSAATSAQPFTIPGLARGRTYQVEIRGVNVAGPGQASGAVAATPHTAPDAPTNLAATSGPGQATLTWNGPASDGGQPITDYLVQYATSAGGMFTPFVHIPSATTTATVTGLTNATAYVFRVAAVNTAGGGPFSSLASATPLSAPAAPTITSITPGSGFLQVAFTSPNNGGSPITGYQYSLDGGTLRTVIATTSPMTITGLTNGHTYSVAIHAVNVVGAGATSNVVSSKPYGLPAGVVGFVAVPAGSSVTLTWDPADDNGSPITAYNIVRWSAASEGSIVASYTTTATTRTITPLGNGNHYFTIEASNAAGTGPRSAPRASAAVGSTVPGAPTVSDITVNGINAELTWSVGNPGSSAITGNIVQYSTDGTNYTTVSHGSATTSVSFELPSSATPYWLRIAAISPTGAGAFSTVHPPVATTGAASEVTTGSATVTGAVDSSGATVDMAFEYATSAVDLGTVSATNVGATPGSVSGSMSTSVTAALAELDPGTTYYVQVVATADGVEIRGAVTTFTTRARIVSSNLDQTYTGAPLEPTVVTEPVGVTLARTYEGLGTTSYGPTSVRPSRVGTYEVTTVVVDDLLDGDETAILTITPKSVTVTIDAVDRPYDGTTNVELSLGLDGAVVGDDVYVDPSRVTGTFADAAAGIDKIVTISAAPNVLAGADAPNYAASTPTETAATIDRVAQVLWFTSVAPAPAVVGATYIPTVTSSAGLTPQLAVGAGAGAVCSLTAGRVTLLAPGICEIVATQPGSENIGAAAVRQAFAVNAAAEVTGGGFTAVDPIRVLDTRSDARLTAGDTYRLDITSGWAVPTTATAVTLNVTAVHPAAAGYLTMYPCGSDRPEASLLNFEAGQTVANMMVVSVDDTRQLCIVASAGTHVVIDLNGIHSRTSGDRLNTTTPRRIIDTRASAKLGAGRIVEIPLADAGAASAAVVNLTVTEPDHTGFLTAYPCGDVLPVVSNLNFVAGQTVANHADVKLSTTGSICVYTSATTNLIVDLTGTFAAKAGSALSVNVPGRLLDTRQGEMIPADGTIEVAMIGSGAAPDGTTAVALNVTVTRATAPGYLTVYPCAADTPTASNINVTPGATVANHVTADVDSRGKSCIYSSVATHVIIDVEGTYRSTD